MTPITILIFISLAINLLLIIWAVWIHFRLRKVFGGKNAKELEQVLGEVQNDLDRVESTHVEIKKRITGAEKRLSHTIRNISTIRFNPFTDQGSNQSFATALVDDHGDGVVLSSLYSRERVSVFAKPVKGGASEFELTDEEKNVLEKAYSHE